MNLSRIGPFAVEERLGGGQEGTVYRAVHIQQHRTVALKVFPAPLVASDPRAKTALVREIEVLKTLQHPHIARCFGGILEQSQGCIASELVEGETLASLLSRRGKLLWETVCDYTLQLSMALEHAHDAGVVHQDLNPHKVVVGDNEQLKIIDFRYDRVSNPTCVSSNKRTLERVRYRAPEQLSGNAVLNHKVDLYALGCIMFEMLVGEPPYDGTTVGEVIRHHLETNPPKVNAIVLDCPVWLESLVRQLLEKDLTRRPYSAGAVTLAVQETHNRVAAKTGVVEHAAGGFSPLQRQVDKDMARDLLKKARREKKEKDENASSPFFEQPWFLALCLLLLLGSIGMWLAWPAREDKLFARAKDIIEQSEGRSQERARPYLERIVADFPAGQHSEEAQQLLDELDMASAERRLRFRTRLGQEPKTEGERLFAEAWKFEQFGDRLTALDKYYGMIDLLPPDGKDRVYLNLARRQIAAIERDTSPEDRIRFVEQRLAEAERVASQGRLVDARKIWNSIVTLYGQNREFSVQVERAQARLAGYVIDPEST